MLGPDSETLKVEVAALAGVTHWRLVPLVLLEQEVLLVGHQPGSSAGIV